MERFLQQLEKNHGAVPVERIGVWRVQAEAAKVRGDQTRLEEYVSRVKGAAFAEPAEPDQIHAIETLFKLKIKCNDKEQKFLDVICANPESAPALKLYAAALSGRQNASNLNRFHELWEEYSSHKTQRSVLLYILRQYPELPEPLLVSVKTLYLDQSIPAEARYAAGIILLKNHQLAIAEIPDKPEKMCGDWLRLQMLMKLPPSTFEKTLYDLRDSSNTELKILAAYAVIKTQEWQ